MFSSSFSIQMKKILILKNTKVVGYGKNGEMTPTGFKIKYYSLFPPKVYKYSCITSVELDWTPTVAHLLEGVKIGIKMKDTRSVSSSSNNTDLMYLRKDAERKWNVSMLTSLYVPMAELKAGIPLHFDIHMPTNPIKENIEIGTLIFKINLITSKCAEPTTIGPVQFSYAEKIEVPDDCMIWKGMSASQLSLRGNTTTELISSYLHGDMDMETLGRQMSHLLASDS